MSLNKALSPADNVDLAEERKKATFDTDELTAVIWESKKAMQRRREITAKVEQFKELHDPFPQAFMTRGEKIDNAARRTVAMMKLMPQIGVDPTNSAEMFHLVNEIHGYDGHPLGLHSVMFIPALLAQADDEQQSWWLGKAMNLEIIGTYAQTELGHGTNLRNLETTATYDKKSEEFVLHSPTTTAMKWWPGNLGKTANHAIVTATLVIEGKSYGPHNFFVQLRDRQTHEPLEGITVGDIGPKFEFGTTDNGFLKFSNLRIPRRHMLMRQSKVHADGSYVAPSHAKMAYSAMVHVRSIMVTNIAMFMASALTTAVRYSCVRRQGWIKDGEAEVRILDYQSQQHRLFPMLARAYAYFFSGAAAVKIYTRVLADIREGKPGDLADLHALTSGLKAVVTFGAGFGIEQARMSCGGHGYSRASGIPQLYGTAIAGATYEGENMVMLLQTARFLMKAAAAARTTGKVGQMVGYLLEKDEKHSTIGRSHDLEYSAHLRAFAQVARKQVFKAFDRLEQLKKSGIEKEEAWNANAVEMQRATRLHTKLFIAQTFKKHVDGIVDHATREIMLKLVQLHFNYELIEMAAYLLQDGYLSTDQLDWMKEDMYRLLGEIRPQAVSLVDAFDFSDHELRSVLGRKDGQVYENLYQWAQNSELNRTQVLPAYHKYLKPMMDSRKEQSKL